MKNVWSLGQEVTPLKALGSEGTTFTASDTRHKDIQVTHGSMRTSSRQEKTPLNHKTAKIQFTASDKVQRRTRDMRVRGNVVQTREIPSKLQDSK